MEVIMGMKMKFFELFALLWCAYMCHSGFCGCECACDSGEYKPSSVVPHLRCRRSLEGGRQVDREEGPTLARGVGEVDAKKQCNQIFAEA